MSSRKSDCCANKFRAFYAATFALLGCALCLASCDRLPESYPPPEQRHPLPGFNPGPNAFMVDMGDKDVAIHIVQDIYGQANPAWRWTAQNPTMRLLLLSTDGLKFLADFSIWDDSFKITGPLEITYLVNGRLLDKVRYDAPGLKHFEKPVPSDWLAVDSETLIGMSVNKLYVSPIDHNKYGVILVRMGFKE
jgi:hypothetical protein